MSGGLVKEDLLKVFHKFFGNEIIGALFSFIALVPKKCQTTRVFYFRPISLVTSLDKTIVKCCFVQVVKRSFT